MKTWQTWASPSAPWQLPVLTGRTPGGGGGGGGASNSPLIPLTTIVSANICAIDTIYYAIYMHNICRKFHALNSVICHFCSLRPNCDQWKRPKLAHFDLMVHSLNNINLNQFFVAATEASENAAKFISAMHYTDYMHHWAMQQSATKCNAMQRMIGSAFECNIVLSSALQWSS